MKTSLLSIDQVAADISPLTFSPQPAMLAWLILFLASLAPLTAQTNTNTTAITTVKSAAAMASNMDTLDDKHKLAIGDKLSFRITEDSEDPKPLVVTDSGDLEVPYIGRFAALNKTCKQLARELKVELEKEYYYQATVIIAVDLLSRARGKIYLVGNIRLPGPQDIPGDEVFTLSKAIMRAGGFTDFADKKNVKITRKGGPNEPDNKVIVVNVADIIEKGKAERDVPLDPGDLVYVPARMLSF